MVTNKLSVKGLNKEVIQSYIITSAKYDFNVYEKRILYRLVEYCQQFLLGQTLDKNFNISKTLFGDYSVVMPVSFFLRNEKDKNYTRIKEGLRSLESKKFEFENDKIWTIIRLIRKPIIEKGSAIISFDIDDLVFKAILDFSKGYKKYELQTAMSFKSIYAMRFYELLSGQKTPITYSIEQLKQMFKIEDKYKETKDFINRVVKKAKTELDKQSPYSFNFETIKKERKITSIQFFPVFITANQDKNLKGKKEDQEISLRWHLPVQITSILEHNFDFTKIEIKRNKQTFVNCYNRLGFEKFIDKLTYLKTYCKDKKAPKGYVIESLKKELD